MAKFCAKCGSRLDESTGLCPNCYANQIRVPEEPAVQIQEKQIADPGTSVNKQPESRKERRKRLRAEKKARKKEAKKQRKADKKKARKQRKADKKAERKARKKEKWAAKPWWKKLLSILLRCVAWLLVLLVAAAGLVVVLGRSGIIEIPAADDILISLGLKEQYHVSPVDADDYFENNSTVIDVIDANTSIDVPTEAQTFETLTERGFTEFPITSDYTMDGAYYDPVDISETSASKHPVYETYHIAENGDVWTIFVINGTVIANPVSYNLQSELGVQVIISETETVISYDSTTNQFYETIPNRSELIVKTIDRIDAETLETLTYGVIDGL